MQKNLLKKLENLFRKRILQGNSIQREPDLFGFGLTSISQFGEIKEIFTFDDLVNLTDNGFVIPNTGRLFIRNIAMKFDKYLITDKSLYSKTV